MSYFTELPKSENGARAYTNSQARVIEMVVETDDFGGHYRVLAPEEFRSRWSTISLHSGFVEVNGPVRAMSEVEYAEVLQEAGVDSNTIQLARQRI